MEKETKFGIIFIISLVIGFAVLCFVLAGPAGCSNRYTAWKASAYGSDWLVVQYALNGSVINHWNLKNKAVHNEGSSDGIYFLNENNESVHLSGHYVYVQNPTEETCKKLLKGK